MPQRNGDGSAHAQGRRRRGRHAEDGVRVGEKAVGLADGEPVHPLSSNSRANRPISALGTGVAPIRQNSVLISDPSNRSCRRRDDRRRSAKVKSV